MRLPKRETLVHPDHYFLYGHDCQELHNPNQSDFTRLHYVSRYNIVLRLVEKYAPTGVALDIGCAQGNFSLALAEKGYRVYAMDLRPTFLQYLRMKHERGDVSCTAASIEHFPFRPGLFDVVLLGEVLEHVAQPEALVIEVARLLKVGGILLATTPNGERIHTGLPTLSAVTDRDSLTSRQFRPDASGHLFLLTRDELIRIAKQARLEVLEHRVFGTPWVTGRLMARYVVRAIPTKVRWLLDRLTLWAPVVKRLVSDGQLLVARLPPTPGRGA